MVRLGCAAILVLACSTSSSGTGGGSEEGPGAIPGLTAADIKLNFENRGFSCEGPGSAPSGVNYNCSSGDFQIFFFGAGVMSIEGVSAVALTDDSDAKDFLGFVATLPYEGSNPSAARAWVEANVGTSASTTFGAAKFTLGGPAGGRTLDIFGT
jgi:hypothetical protein